MPEKENTQVDFLAIGDIVTDAFIELDPEHSWIETDNPQENKELCMMFGDKLPYKDVIVVPAVGNSPNAATSAHRLGLHSALMTDLGDDAFGKEQLAALEEEGIDTQYVRVHEGEDSNYHYVLRYGPERTILVKHTEFPYLLPEKLEAPKFIYLSSLAENSLEFHDIIANYLEAHPETKLAFQPGTFQMKLGIEKLRRLYKNAYLFFCNVEEAQRILETTEKDVKILLEKMRELGPEVAVITDGPNGAYVSDGQQTLWGPMYPDPAPPIDRTGAGDSFASTFTSMLALGKTLEEALLAGPINSMSVVQHVGAQAGLLPMQELQKFLEDAPKDYKIKEL